MRDSSIRGYLGLFRIGLINVLAYRASAWSFILSGAFYGFIQVSIILAFFTYGDTANIDMAQQQGVTHMWLVVILYGAMPFAVHTNLHQKIVSGLVAFDLCRPLDLYWHWYSSVISAGLRNLIVHSTLITVMAVLLPLPYKMGLPVSVPAFCLFVLSFCLAMMLSASISMLVSMGYINADMGLGISQFLYAVTVLMSGDLFPLQILPKAVVDVLRVLPFAGLKDIPVSIYLGIIPMDRALGYMGIQIIWIAAFILLGRLILSRFKKKIVIQGG